MDPSPRLPLFTIQPGPVPEQEAFGPHRSPVKPVKINININSKLWLYHSDDVKRRKNNHLLFIITWSFLQNLESLSPKTALCQFYISSMYFCCFVIIFPLKRAMSFIRTNLNPLCLLEIGPYILDKIFKISSMYFHYFVIISSWKRAEPFISANFNSLAQGCFVTSLVEIGPVFLEKKIFKFRPCVFAIS